MDFRLLRITKLNSTFSMGSFRMTQSLPPSERFSAGITGILRGASLLPLFQRNEDDYSETMESTRGPE